MLKMLKYSSQIKVTPYLYKELKLAAKLKLKGFSSTEIKDKSIKENIFSMKTEQRKREFASTVTRRLDSLDDYLLDKVVNSDLETSKQIALYSILKTDLLFFEFMKEVYKDKILLKDYKLTDKDFNTFFQRKSEQSERVASWSEYNFNSLKGVYKRILLQAGFIDRQGVEVNIIPPVMKKELVEYLLEKGDRVYLEAMLGEIQ